MAMLPVAESCLSPLSVIHTIRIMRPQVMDICNHDYHSKFPIQVTNLATAANENLRKPLLL